MPVLLQQGMETGPPYVRDAHMMVTMVRARKWRVHEDFLMHKGQTRVFPNDLPDKSPWGVKLGVGGERRFAPTGVMKDTEPGVSYSFVPVHVLCLGVLSKVLSLYISTR